MIAYQYQIIRYRHDLTSGEHVNVGVIVYAKEARFLKCEIITKYGRINSFYKGADGKSVVDTLKALKRGVVRIERNFGEFLDMPDGLHGITSSILPYDDSSIFLTDVLGGVDWNMPHCLKELFRLYVTRWQAEPEEISETDAEAWKDKFKPIFDRYNITNRLIPLEVNTENDVFRFEKTWQNASLHCIQPISFNLKTADGVKGKVYTWSGKLQEIKTASQQLDIIFFSSRPLRHGRLVELVRNTLSENSDVVRSTVVFEEEADDVVAQIAEQMRLHDEGSEFMDGME